MNNAELQAIQKSPSPVHVGEVVGPNPTPPKAKNKTDDSEIESRIRELIGELKAESKKKTRFWKLSSSV